MLLAMNELGRIIEDFRSRYRLSKAKAAEVLGVSVLYVRSLESGVDVRTGLPFKPREATLMQLAAKMSDFGYVVTPSELMRAAGIQVPAAAAVALDIGHAIRGVTTANKLGAPTKAGKLPPLASFIYTRREAMSVEELARKVDVAPTLFDNIDAGYIPPADLLAKIADALGVTLDEIQAATKGKPAGNPTPGASDAMQQYSILTGPQVELPYYGRVGCGEFLDLSDQPLGLRDVPLALLEGEPVEDMATLEAWGNSMNLAGILPGQTLLIRKQAYAEPGQVVIATVPFQGTTCKRYVKRPDGLYLVAESSEQYPDIKMAEGITLDGVVRSVWSFKRFS